jgi:hypothetical protein
MPCRGQYPIWSLGLTNSCEPVVQWVTQSSDNLSVSDFNCQRRAALGSEEVQVSIPWSGSL